VSFQTESPSLVGDVSRREDESEADPEENRVHGEEGSVVEDDSSVSDESGDEVHTQSDGRDWKRKDTRELKVERGHREREIEGNEPMRASESPTRMMSA